MGTVTSIDFGRTLRTRRVGRSQRVRRCVKCRCLVEHAGFCSKCLAAIDADAEALRYAKLRDEAARLCCGCLWPIPPRTQLAVDPETGDLWHAGCAERLAGEREGIESCCDEQQGSNAS